MIERRLQTTVVLVLLFSHISIPLLVLGFFLAGGLSSSEFTTTLGIIVPMLAALSGLALAFVIRNKKRPKGNVKSDQITGAYAVTAVVLPVLLSVLTAGLVGMKAYNFGIASFEDFKISLAAIETVFGAYTGKIVASLFEEVPSS